MPAKPTSQPYKHSNKIQCRYELQISAKAKVNSNKNLLSFVSCCQPVTSMVYHGSFRMSLCSFMSLQESPTANSSYSTVVAYNKFENLWLLEMCQHQFLRIFTNFKNFVKFTNCYEF